MRFNFIIILFAIFFTGESTTIIAESIQTTKPLKIYMMPNGHNKNDGLSLDTAITSLDTARFILNKLLPNKDRSVEILIGSGTYYEQEVYWSLTMPDYNITFQPYSLNEPMPVFDGRGVPGMFRLIGHSDGEKTNIIIRNLKFKNYGNVITFRGDRTKVKSSSSFNVIEGCSFENTGIESFSTIGLVNSRNNKIINNHFKDVLRLGERSDLLHAIYVAHSSSNNLIDYNNFTNCDGDPVRIRDNSNNNTVSNNTFDYCGHSAVLSEWFCNRDVVSYCSEYTECPSYNNLFYKNEIIGNGGIGARDSYTPIYVGTPATIVSGCTPTKDTARVLYQKKIKDTPDTMTNLISYMTL